MNRNILIIACIAVAGCSHVPADMSSSVHPADNASFTLNDARPKSDSQSGMGSLSVTNCNYGIMRLPDTAGVPGKVTVLKDDLQELAGSKLAGKTITVRSYVLYYNGALELRGALSNAQPGLIAHVMINIGCKKEDVDGGWYDADEVTNNYSPFVADLTVEMDGKSYHSHAVKSSDVPYTRRDGGDPNYTDTMRATLRKVAENLVTALSAAQQ